MGYTGAAAAAAAVEDREDGDAGQGTVDEVRKRTAVDRKRRVIADASFGSKLVPELDQLPTAGALLAHDPLDPLGSLSRCHSRHHLHQCC